MRRRGLLLFLCALASLSMPIPAGGQDSLESELLSLINNGRPGAMTAHSGLRSAGREHSREMSSDGELNHNGAAGRIGSAQPDPAEPNGPPDDGFTGTWCENVAYVRGAPDSEVPRRIYEAWQDSPSHDRCMNNSTMTVAGVGMYYESSTDKWWATLELAEDRTLPGTTPQTAEPSPTPVPIRTEPPERTEPPLLELRTEPPEPTAQPTASATPNATQRADSAGVDVTSATTTVDEAVGAAAESAIDRSTQAASSAGLRGSAVSTSRATFGWVELAATLGVLALVGELLRRLSRRRET